MNTHILKLKQPAFPIDPIVLDAMVWKKPKLLRAMKRQAILFVSLALALTLSYPNIKRIAVKVVYAFLILDAALLAFNLFRVYGPLTVAERTHMAVYLGSQAPERDAHLAKPAPLGTSEKSLVAQLEAQNMSVVVAHSGTRTGLSAPEHTLTVGTDTIFTYEYKNAETAAAEARTLSESYLTKSKPGLWDTQAHIYTQGNLIVFYLGTRPEMLASLSAIAGNSLINEPKNTALAESQAK